MTVTIAGSGGIRRSEVMEAGLGVFDVFGVVGACDLGGVDLGGVWGIEAGGVLR